MDAKNLLKTSSIPLALFLLVVSACFLLIKLLGYTLVYVPIGGLILNILSAGIIIWLTINGVINRKNKTKVTVVFSALIPLIALLFIVVKSISTDTSGEYHNLYAVYITGKNTMIYIVNACVALICSMVLFYSCGRGKAIRIGLGIMYTIMFAFIFLLFFMAFIMSDFGKNTVIQAEMSPNAIYLAEVIDSDQGALGGASLVNVTKQNRDVYLLIGNLKKDAKEIYYGRWGESFEMTLRWETDNVLYINGNRYIIP